MHDLFPNEKMEDYAMFTIQVTAEEKQYIFNRRCYFNGDIKEYWFSMIWWKSNMSLEIRDRLLSLADTQAFVDMQVKNSEVILVDSVKRKLS